MSEYNEQVMKLMGIMQNKQFLFPKGMPSRLRFSLYFDWFETHNKEEFNQMPSMVHFNPDILDQFSKKIVWTGFAPTDGINSNSYALHSLVQIKKDFHIIFLFAHENNDVSVLATLYLLNIKDYLNFIKENDQYIIKKKSPAGFAIGGFGVTQ